MEKSWTPDRIQALRERFKLSQVGFARMLGAALRYQTISEWERGHHKPSPAHLQLLDRLEHKVERIWNESGKDSDKFYDLLERRLGIIPKRKAGRPRVKELGKHAVQKHKTV